MVIKDKVLELLLYFTKNDDEEVQTKAIIGLGKYLLSMITEFPVFTFDCSHGQHNGSFGSPGFLFIQHPDLMFASEVKNLYNLLLADRKTSVNLKIQVLKNLQTYLQEEDSRMQEADRECECRL